MAIDVQEIADAEQWNTFLLSHPRRHILQTYEWGEINSLSGSQVYRLGAFDQDRLVGTMVLSLNPLPVPVPGITLRAAYCIRGPMVEKPDEQVLSTLLEKAHEIARREHAIMLRVEPNIADDDGQMNVWLQAYLRLGFRENPYAVHMRRSWVLDIRPGAEELLTGMKMTWRQNVRASERKGVQIRLATTEADFDAYYALLEITSQRDDFFLQGKEVHQRIKQNFEAKGDYALLLAEHEGEIIAAKVLIRHGDWCWDMFSGSANQKRNLKATYLLQYHAFLWAKAQGCHFFDFRTIPEVLQPGEEMWGVYEYKRGFGGFSRLNIPSLDYVYRPVLYTIWQRMIAAKRARRRQERQKIELARVERGKQTVMVQERNTYGD